jgi:cytoskeletal protein RodZ
MTTPTTPRGDPPHQPGPVGLVTRLLLVQLLAVVGVAAVIAVVFALAGWGTDPSVTAVPGATTSSGVAARASSIPATTSTPPASTAPATTPAATTPAPTTTPAATDTTKATDPAADLPKVDVLNQSAGSGAAGQAARLVRDSGWRVGRVADFHGNVSTTTVYYPPGLGREAHDLAAALPGDLRVRPGFSTLSDSRLSIILVEPVG